MASTYPDSGATGVSGVDSLVIAFSEPMNRRSVEQSFQIVPSVDFSRLEWKEQVWTLRLRAPLLPHTTYVGFVGADAEDRRRNKLGRLWSFAFSTGDTLDDGEVSGRVVGQRFSPNRLWVYAWPWEIGMPDTTESGFPPPPLRLGQTDDAGQFRIGHLPREEPLRICAFYDRDADGQFQPIADRWACLSDSVVLADTSSARGDLALFLAEADEPGTIAGTVVDSFCVKQDYQVRLSAMRAERDSLLEWLEGEYEMRGRGRRTMSLADSMRIEAQFSQYALTETAALRDSTLCARSIFVQLFTVADSLMREAGGPEFEWADVPPGIYRLRAFRDINETGERESGEPRGSYPFAIEVAPLRTIDDLGFAIELPEGETLLEPSTVSESAPAAEENP